MMRAHIFYIFDAYCKELPQLSIFTKSAIKILLHFCVMLSMHQRLISNNIFIFIATNAEI